MPREIFGGRSRYEQNFLPVIRFSTISIIPPVIHTLLYGEQGERAWGPSGNLEHLVGIFNCLLRLQPLRMFTVLTHAVSPIEYTRILNYANNLFFQLNLYSECLNNDNEEEICLGK
jgi:hypothetical protein